MRAKDRPEWINERDDRRRNKENIHESLKMGAFQEKNAIGDRVNSLVVIIITKNYAKE